MIMKVSTIRRDREDEYPVPFPVGDDEKKIRVKLKW